MIELSQIIELLVKLGSTLNEQNAPLNAAIRRTYNENNWLTPENYAQAIIHWVELLTEENLLTFTSAYGYASTPKSVGIIMAGNIPLVGFHDLLCVLLSGNKAVVKPSSDDKYVIEYICKALKEMGLKERIEIVEKLSDIDAVIATGSNNSHRYFQHYFKHLPSLLRKNRKSIAVIDGSETDTDLKLLADDIFTYYGLGCRNVSLVLVPESYNVTSLLDHLMIKKEVGDHNKYANNYTYHRAMYLMNQVEHLDMGFCLVREQLDLNVPLACLYYSYYKNVSEVETFIKEQQENIQCVVGNYSHSQTVSFGMSQNPDLQSFADNVDTMKFLNNLEK